MLLNLVAPPPDIDFTKIAMEANAFPNELPGKEKKIRAPPFFA